MKIIDSPGIIRRARGKQSVAAFALRVGLCRFQIYLLEGSVRPGELAIVKLHEAGVFTKAEAQTLRTEARARGRAAAQKAARGQC